MHFDDFIRLVMESDHPVEFKIVSGRINRAIIRANDKEMQEHELRRLMQQIGERAKHGTLTASRQGGKIVVTWEESVLIGQRR